MSDMDLIAHIVGLLEDEYYSNDPIKESVAIDNKTIRLDMKDGTVKYLTLSDNKTE